MRRASAAARRPRGRFPPGGARNRRAAQDGPRIGRWGPRSPRRRFIRRNPRRAARRHRGRPERFRLPRRETMLGKRVPQRTAERVRQQVGAGKARNRRLLDDGAVLEHRHTVGRAQRELDIVSDEQHAAARVRESAEVFERAHGQIEVEAGRGLVCDDDARVVHERAAQKHAARHAARQLMGIKARRLLVQTVAREQLPAARSARGGRNAGPGEPLHLPAHLHERVEVVHALRHERDAAPAQARKRRGVLPHAVEPDAAAHDGIRLEQPEDGIDQKRLARARRAHHRHDLAGVHRNAHVLDDGHDAPLRPEERRVLVVHAKAHLKPLYLQQVVTALVTRSRSVRVAMVRLRVPMARALMLLFGHVVHLASLHLIPARYAGRRACAGSTPPRRTRARTR